MSRPAFTLVEVVVVLAIIGILATVAAPAFVMPRDGAEPLTVAAAETRRVLERARSTALARGAPVVVTIDPRAARYRVDIENAEGRELVADSVIAVAPTVRIGATSRHLRLRIEPTGTTWGDSVVLTAGGRAAIVSADRWSGEIRVREP